MNYNNNKDINGTEQVTKREKTHHLTGPRSKSCVCHLYTITITQLASSRGLSRTRVVLQVTDNQTVVLFRFKDVLVHECLECQ